MKSKNIANIVFYKYFDGEKVVTNSTIFYTNGSVKNGTYEDGIDACEEIVNELKITSKDAFREMINRDIVHVMSGREFTNNYSKFVSDSRVATEEVVAPTITDVPSVEEVETINFSDSEDEDAEIEDESEEDLEEKEEEKEKTLSENEIDEDIEDEDLIEDEENVEEKQEKQGLFTKVANFFRNPVRKVVACATALAMGLGMYGCAARMTKDGKMVRSNLASLSAAASDDRDDVVVVDTDNNKAVIADDNDCYDKYDYSELVTVTRKETQKEAMETVYKFMSEFNGSFASAYVEQGKEVRAALTFEEVVALQQAYNNYSRNEIKAIFNGADIRADELTRAYKSASLQLMGAYVIETSKNPVDVSSLIVSEEGREFYSRYHRMFLEAKEAKTKVEKQEKVSAFYKAVREDFPISQKIRTEGIAHADAYASIEAYKLSVAPMIAAAEMLFQNLDVDYTLNDSEIDFINDIGLCNYAERTFERIETITLSSEEDNISPLYEQYMMAIISEFKAKGWYVIDDYHRDLSTLQAFYDAVNWHFEMEGNYSYNGGYSYSTRTYQTKSTRTESSTSYRTEETRTEKPIPSYEKERIDREIEAENEIVKSSAEKDAAEYLKWYQSQEDAKADKIREEIAEEERDLDNKIKEANDKIDNNNKDQDTSNDRPVNEKDFGNHGVDFDDNYSDSNGNLDNSVKDITKDGSNDKTYEPLPDPNVTGAEFDSRVSNDYQPTYVPPVEVDPPVTYEPEYSSNDSYPVYEYSAPSTPSYETVIDSYVNNMADDYSSYENYEPYQYTLN